MTLTADWREKLAKPLKILPSDLEDYPDGVSNSRPVAVILWDQLALPVDEILSHINDQTERVGTVEDALDLLAVQITGNTMSAIAPDGSFLIYNPQDTNLTDGRYYIFQYGGEVLFRLWRDTDGPRRFEAESRESGQRTIYPEGGFRVIGRVVEVVKRLP